MQPTVSHDLEGFLNCMCEHSISEVFNGTVHVLMTRI